MADTEAETMREWLAWENDYWRTHDRDEARE